MEYYGLHDLGFVGNKYTWERGRTIVDWIRERLDRALASNRWWQLLISNPTVYNLETAKSDHSAIFASLGLAVIQYAPKQFFFENSWLKEIDDHRAVQEAWNVGKGSNIQEQIRCCGEHLASWGRMKRNQFRDKLRQCKSQMERYKQSSNPDHIQLYRIAKDAYV